ncbi:cell wall metabolism sensor histidine kinase WalK [Gloeocapsa sp. PCC 73106]|uniref:sensor histidine kinase n=1 Tax=Gloeocapsa sp. PCC 73106 TaxID=102232 RepID=UPI0002AC2607|nr:HAMP domain-containing sensor histidine kinase [Gloeocapsa sp. PCC 73106]ELR99030.1 histidine kinase [Gloeocapsa sp. PCC 73106]
MFQKTRFRLALWYTSITGILLLLFATGVYLYVRYTLVERIDDTLEHVVELMENPVIIEGLRTSNQTSLEDDRIDVEWFNADGDLVWATFFQPPAIPLIPNNHGKTVSITPNYQLRQITKTIVADHQILGYLRVSHPWFEVTKPSRQLIKDLSLGIILMVTCVAALGWFLSGIAIKPVIESYQSLRQFTADASHELRNPLAMIQANVQTALTEPEINPQQLKVIERLTQRLGRLVNDLLFLARSDSGMLQVTPQSVPLDALLIEVIEEQRIFARQKGVDLILDLTETESESEPFTIQGDWDQLARLFTNLVSNAIAYTQDQVTVQLERIKKGSRHYVRIRVSDRGCGIPEEAIPHIFERFYRADSARIHLQESPQTTGAGLGLAIVSAIVDNHQGQIKVESKLNQGTIFTVTLPIVA